MDLNLITFRTNKNITKNSPPKKSVFQNNLLFSKALTQDTISFKQASIPEKLAKGESVSYKELINSYQEYPELFEKPLTPFDNPEVIKNRIKIAKEKMQQKTQKTNYIEYNDEKRTKFIDKFYGEGAKLKEKQAIIIIGSPGAGKSTMLKKLSNEYGALIIDGDDIRQKMPEYQKTQNFKITRFECAILKNKLLEKALKNNDNVIFQTGGMKEDEILTLKEKINNQKGYISHLVLVDVKPETAAKRVVKRLEETGRFTDPYQILYEIGKKPLETFQSLKEKNIFEHFILYTNE